MTRQIIDGGARPPAADAFAAYYRLKELRRATAPVWQAIDVLMTPTAGRQYTIAEVLADPMKLNSALGYYTNFVNLLDLTRHRGARRAAAGRAAVRRHAGRAGLAATPRCARWPTRCTAPATNYHRRAGHAARRPAPLRPAPAAGTVRLAVCGAHMTGLPLNQQLTERGAPAGPRLPHRAAAIACSRCPAARRRGRAWCAPTAGAAIEVEVWELPIAAFGSFVAGIPAPLGIGTVELEDGETVKGFLCEAHATAEARDITELGGWRRYLDDASRDRWRSTMPTVRAEPYEFEFEPGRVALVIIDMQRDFVDPGGFGEALGNDVSLLRRAIAPTARVLAAARAAGHAGDPHPRGPSPRSRRPAAGQEGARAA